MGMDTRELSRLVDNLTALDSPSNYACFEDACEELLGDLELSPSEHAVACELIEEWFNAE